MGPPGIVVPDHQGNGNVILQNCGDTDVYIPRGSLIGNVENSAINKSKLAKDLHLNAVKLQKQFDNRARPLAKSLNQKEKRRIFSQSKN